MNLDNIGMNVTGLTGEVVLIRVGKDKRLALDKRNADSDLFRVLELLHKHYGKDFKQEFKSNDGHWLEYTVKRIKTPKGD